MKTLTKIARTLFNIAVILCLGIFLLAFFWLAYFMLSFASLLLVIISRVIGEKETWSTAYDMLAADLKKVDSYDDLFADFDEKKTDIPQEI